VRDVAHSHSPGTHSLEVVFYEIHLTRVVRWSTVFHRSHTLSVCACQHGDRNLYVDPRLASPRFRRRPREAEIATHGLLYHLLLTADARAPDLLQPYCNRASTRWYTVDKTMAPDDPKPPK
jgi:hypothetical protein